MSVSKNKKSEEIVIFYTCLLPYLSDSIEKLVTTESLCNKKSYWKFLLKSFVLVPSKIKLD